MDKNWKSMTPDEKQESLFQSWISPQGVQFASPAAQKAYQERVTRIKNAIQLQSCRTGCPFSP
jgi:hypothetical protein